MQDVNKYNSSTGSESVSHQALQATHSKKHNRGPKCNGCGMYGHIKKNCRKNPNKHGADFGSGAKQKSNNNALIVTLCSKENFAKNTWYIDSGATSHMTSHRDLFETFEELEQANYVTTAKDYTMKVIGKGDIVLNLRVYNKVIEVTMRSVMYYTYQIFA